MGTFGFSYIGLLWLLMLMIPNFFWTKNKPAGYSPGNESKALQILERAGEVCVTCSALIFSDFNLKPFSIRSIWLILSFLLMLLYEIWWIRYFRGPKTLKDFYSSILRIPVAGAVLPVLAFFFLSLYGDVIWLAISAVILGIGHIGIHLQHFKELAE